MRIAIFAGGSGRRLWPISRQSSPKQFEPIVGELSTLQLAMERVAPQYGYANVFVSTNERYGEIVCYQLPELPPANIIFEPARRDLGPAVGLAMAHLAADSVDEPVAILWSDNYIENNVAFADLLKVAERLIVEQKAQIIFIGETPRFANENLGWIGLGKEKGIIDDTPYFGFESLTYRPSLDQCRMIFEQGTHVWNTGFFVTTPAYIQQLYKRFSPDMWSQLQEIEASIGAEAYRDVLARIYPEMRAISFDDAILTHLDPEDALVLHSEMGWSDPGTLYALKEALNPDRDANVIKGLVIDTESRDCLIYNYEPEKIVMAVGLEGMIVINTDDAILVVHKDYIPLVKKAVDGLQDTELESYS
ncbi:MAG TPA: sugar phosphate nucleotidyltransferase [Promineifilum sp.]|nr:sugar phosphate nucleotidyltransferase [Promineifilum sp.]HRQ12085.1 sugar phosphate nucleotidyltransferase [Promineifilum sp.]